MSSWILFHYILTLWNSNNLNEKFLLKLSFLVKERLCLVHPWTWHLPSCHKVQVTCDNLPHFTDLHRWCAHWMQHYAALRNSTRDWCYDQIIHCSKPGCIFLVFSAFFSLMLTSHFCVLSIPSVYSSFVLYIHVVCRVLCFLRFAFRLFSSAIP